MAGDNRAPDHWSDHDFWVIVEDGEAETLRTDTSWYPDADRIVLHFRETPHGVKVLYDDGHLLEPAVFERDELGAARAGNYRVLVDKAGIAELMREITERTASEDDTATRERFLFGQFLTNLLVGVGRWARGERHSGSVFVTQHAVGHLLQLAALLGAAHRTESVDSLDPHRRVELAFPELAEHLALALADDVPTAAENLLGLAQRVAPQLFVEQEKAILAVERRVREAFAGAGGRRGGLALHHVQIAIPSGGEERGRAFYTGLLGMTEIQKPPSLNDRGGCWFRADGVELHLGVDTDFVPARKAHPGFMVTGIDSLADRLSAAGHQVSWDTRLPEFRRFHTTDPFGNRLEFLQREP